MIINTGQRTDIPAFYSKWFINRLKEGYVCVRNPYNPKQVNKYRLDPSVVDLIAFCTKNPAPMLPYMDLLKEYGQYWFITLTPYGKDIEPNVPDKHKILEDIKKLSQIVGKECIGVRYDPIFISKKYTKEYHLRAFKTITQTLKGYTNTIVISFIDFYDKVKRNFPECEEVSVNDQIDLVTQFVKIAKENDMVIRMCAEGEWAKEYGANVDGCMTKAMINNAIKETLNYPNIKPARASCDCLIINDIGAYDTCLHLCKYCYANNNREAVIENNRNHDPDSPLLIGHLEEDDKIHETKQVSWKNKQISLF